MDSRTHDELVAMDRASFMHPSTDLKGHASGALGTPRIIEGADGIRIRDADGREFIDAFAGLYCVNVGYGRTEIADAIDAQARKLAYYHVYAGHSHEGAIRLSQRIIDMAGPDYSKVYYGQSGSDANETNVKLVWYYWNVLGRPEKRKIISRQRGYHGSGIMSGSLTGLPLFHQAFNLPLPDVKHTVTPHAYWNAAPGTSDADFSAHCAAELEQMILAEGPDTVAAFIGEPVMGTGGLIPPPEGYWAAIQQVLDRYDILLIADEVVTGFGRIGKPFGVHHYGMRADLVTVAKGLTSGYLPLSGSIIGKRMWEVLEQGSVQFGPIGHGWTYSAHPLGTAAALANLDIIEREDLIGNAERTGGLFQQKLHAAFDGHPIVGEVRGVSLLAALEFVQDPTHRTRFDPALKVGPRIAAACLEEGLIARAMPHGDILGFAPPLIVDSADLDEIIGRARTAVDRVTDQLAREGALATAAA
ncbi:MAG TPA: aminotransferase [Pseudomonadales bacterium]|nr:aminotransferase [Pseudomonadales bacterium]